MSVSRLVLLMAAVGFAAAAARADLIFLKDGHVLQGKVRREYSASSTPSART